MPFIMIIYYILCGYISIMLIWNFIKEKKSIEEMLHYLLVLFPMILRILRVK